MKIHAAESVQARCIELNGARGVRMRMLIGPEQRAPNFNMRMFEVDVQGHTPRHTHAWEHEVYVLSGRGVVRTTEGERPIGPGDCVYVAPEEDHQFANVGSEPLRFLCVVPCDRG